MNPVDLIVLVLLALGMLTGARAGFPGPVLGLFGAAIGLGLAILAASVLAQPLLAIDQPLRALVTFVGLGLLVVSGEAIGAGAGRAMSHGLRRGRLRSLDVAGGAIVGAAHVILLVWLVGGLVTVAFPSALGPATRNSVALRVVAERLPAPDTVAGRILALLDTTDLPRLFAGIEPAPAPPVDLPADTRVAALAESAIPATTRVSTSGCGTSLSVGSAFYVTPTHAITNAHVVAGATDARVTSDAGTLEAEVVAFDPEADLALLHVPGAASPALQLSPTTPERGAAAAVIGYPGGGDLTVTAAGITATYSIGGPDIYGEGRHQRSVVEIRGEVRRGNSGGPLVVAPGVVGAVIFGASRASADVGYAIGADEALERIGPLLGSTTPVDTGACL